MAAMYGEGKARMGGKVALAQRVAEAKKKMADMDSVRDRITKNRKTGDLGRYVEAPDSDDDLESPEPAVPLPLPVHVPHPPPQPCPHQRPAETKQQKQQQPDKPHKISREAVLRMFEIAKLYTSIENRLRNYTEKLEKHGETIDRIEAVSEEMQQKSEVFSVIWQLEQFEETFRSATSGEKPVVYSPTFQTHPYGYNIGISLCPNGDGKASGTHMSIFFSVLRGENDTLLAWPFDHRIQFTLLDQAEDVDNRKDITAIFAPYPSAANLVFLQRPQGFRNPSLGLPSFVSHKVLWSQADHCYVKDDRLFIRVTFHVNNATSA